MWQVSYRSHYAEFTTQNYPNEEANDSTISDNGALFVRGDYGVIAVYAPNVWHHFRKFGDGRS